MVFPKVLHNMSRRQRQSPDPEALYRIAEQQGGYFTAAQAAAAGYSWERLSYYAARGRFLRAGRGICRLAQFPSSPFEDLFRVWLQCGPQAAISHESALAVHGLSDLIPGEVHVTVPRSASRRRKRIRQHTSRLSWRDIQRREGLPVTSAARTILDVAAAGLYEDQVRRAIGQALDRGLAQSRALLAAARRKGGRARRIVEAALLQRTSGA